MKAIAGWIVRRGALYLLLVLAIAFGTLAWPWLSAQWNGAGDAAANVATLESTIAEVENMRGEAQARLEKDARQFRRFSQDRIARELAERKARRRVLQAEDKGGSLLDAIDPAAILASKRRGLEIAVLSREIEALSAAQRAAATKNIREARAAAVRSAGPIPTEAATRKAERRCDAARAALREFEARRWIEERLRELLTDERTRLTQTRNRLCERAEDARARRRLYTGLREAEADYEAARGWTAGTIGDVTGDLETRLQREEEQAAGSLRGRAERAAEQMHLSAILKAAALALIGILVMPYFIRLFFWFVLAPIAERRAAIRLAVPGGTGPAIAPAPPSRTSVAVRLEEGEELLVRQDYLQTSSHAGVKETQWLLDRHHPLSSLATGMSFLTRIRGAGEVTTISAVRDPFAEVTIVTLPPDSACVLQPRALAAVVQNSRRRMRITSHWRLFSLNAWLTLQLRYLVFHGPARLVIKGGRGVRVERAERGRVFAQDQLVGFSADLAYSVTRTETFWPYFLKREPLLKDRVEEGEGVLIVEEAPLAGKQAAALRSGAEGAFDAALRMVGL